MSVTGNKNASKYSEEKVNAIIQMVSNGNNIVEACKMNDISYTTWCNWKREYPPVLKLYTHARQDKAEYHEYLIDEVIADLKNKNIDYTSARIIIDTLKWKMSKFYPKMFGADSKVSLEQKGQEDDKQVVIFHIPDNGRNRD